MIPFPKASGKAASYMQPAANQFSGFGPPEQSYQGAVGYMPQVGHAVGYNMQGMHQAGQGATNYMSQVGGHVAGFGSPDPAQWQGMQQGPSAACYMAQLGQVPAFDVQGMQQPGQSIAGYPPQTSCTSYDDMQPPGQSAASYVPAAEAGRVPSYAGQSRLQPSHVPEDEGQGIANFARRHSAEFGKQPSTQGTDAFGTADFGADSDATCSNCGKSLVAGAAFCPHCGHKQGQVAGDVEAVKPPPTMLPSTPATSAAAVEIGKGHSADLGVQQAMSCAAPGALAGCAQVLLGTSAQQVVEAAPSHSAAAISSQSQALPTSQSTLPSAASSAPVKSSATSTPTAVGVDSATVAQAIAAPSQPVVESSFAEITIECIKAFGVDLRQMSQDQLSINFKLQKGVPSGFGRAHQSDQLEKLLPDERLRACVSRNHFTLAWNGQSILLKRLSANAMLINDAFVPMQQDVPASSGCCINLCSEVDGQVPFLSFVLRAKGQVQHAVSEGRENVSASEHRFLCTLSSSCDLSSLSPEAKSVVLVSRGSTMIGRHHQPGYFEKLLGSDSKFLTFVSRSHLEVTEQAAGKFVVKNLSQNPVVIKSQQLGKDGIGCLNVGENIDFIAGPSLERFLCLTLEALGTGTQGQDKVAEVGAQATPQPRAPTPPPRSVVAKSSPKALVETAAFWLELWGSAVIAQMNQSQRKVLANAGGSCDGTRAGVIVGRNIQPEMLVSALADAALTWVSREHFRVEESNAGPCVLSVISNNPIWRRRGADMVILRKQDTCTLEHGDQVLLYTGASDGQPEGPGNKGSIVWVFCKP